MTYPQNTPSVDDMLKMPTGELAQMPVALLAALQGGLDDAGKQLKAPRRVRASWWRGWLGFG